jgi:ketosteroid isomerase-like protein
MSTREQVEQLVRQQEQAIRAKDINQAMAQYSTDIVSFDVVDTLQKVGIDSCRDRLVSWLSQFPGELSFNIEDLSIVAGEELAICHSINHVSGTRAGGDKIDMRWRSTVCYSKSETNWLITHEHSSVPFHPETGKALIDLEE